MAATQIVAIKDENNSCIAIGIGKIQTTAKIIAERIIIFPDKVFFLAMNEIPINSDDAQADRKNMVDTIGCNIT